MQGRRLGKAEQKAAADELEKKLDELSAKLVGSQEITLPSKLDDEPPPIKEKGEKGTDHPPFIPLIMMGLPHPLIMMMLKQEA